MTLNQKSLCVLMLISSMTLPAMYKARCTPFSSAQKRSMANTIYNLIDKSKKSVLVAMYMFTDKEAMRKLALAQARGVDVKVIMDQVSVRAASRCMPKFFKKTGVPLLVYKSSERLHHNKYMIIDDQKVWMSSANWTNAAFDDKNRESGVLIVNSQIAKFYKEDFQNTEASIKQQRRYELIENKKVLAELDRERQQHLQEFKKWKKSQKKS